MVRKRWPAAAVALLVAAACQGGTSGGAPPVQIGVVAPFSGPDAQFGKLLSAPCIVASRLIDAAGGIMGASVSCLSIDDTGDPADAVPNVTRALATSGNLRMVVGLESQTAATTIPLVEKAKIPFFTANGLDAFDRTTDRFFWRMTAPDSANGVAFALWASRKGYRRPAIVFENNIGAEGNLPGLQAAMPRLGQTAVIDLTIPGDAASYSSVVDRVVAARPDVLVFSADPQTAATFLSQYSQLNGGSLPPMVTATDSLTPDFFNAVAKAVGVQYVTRSIYLVGSYFDNTTPAFATYARTMSSTPAVKGIARTILSIGPPASIYDGINIMALAMEMAKSTSGPAYDADITRVVSPRSGAVVVHDFAAGKKAIESGKSVRYVGVIGPVTFNRYHNFAGEFAANMFNPDGTSHQVGVMSGADVQSYLG